MDVNVLAFVYGHRVAVFGNFQIVPFGRSDQQYLVDVRFRRKLGKFESFAAGILPDRTVGFNGYVFADHVRILNHILGIDHFAFFGLEDAVGQLALVPARAFRQFGLLGLA